LIRKLVSTNAPAAVLLIRPAVATIFLSEGIQKFLFAEAQGVGRFMKIGIPAPGIMAPFVGGFEMGRPALPLAGLLTGLAAIPWSGFRAMAHEARTDFAMLLSRVFALIIGAGAWSADARWSENART
jgi:putative oxidoreductase